jgi:hypothetical protein
VAHQHAPALVPRVEGDERFARLVNHAVT